MGTGGVLDGISGTSMCASLVVVHAYQCLRVHLGAAERALGLVARCFVDAPPAKQMATWCGSSVLPLLEAENTYPFAALLGVRIAFIKRCGPRMQRGQCFLRVHHGSDHEL